MTFGYNAGITFKVRKPHIREKDQVVDASDNQNLDAPNIDGKANFFILSHHFVFGEHDLC